MLTGWAGERKHLSFGMKSPEDDIKLYNSAGTCRHLQE
ncbi:HNH endonuclease [Salmonella phage 39]|nr:HNH endonuclease [Salmonella phage 39]